MTFVPSRLTAAVLLAGSSLIAIGVAAPSSAQAACQLAVPVPGASGNNPPPGATVNCVDNLDSEGVVNAAATGVTVNIESPAGGISTTGQPGVLLGADTTVNVNSEGGSNRPINTSGDSAAGIDVTTGATITVDGQVTTSGEVSPAIDTDGNANITVGTTGLVSTGGGSSPAITVGENSTITVRGAGGDSGGRVTTGNSDSDAVVLRGTGGTLTVESGAIVTTSSGGSNPVQVDGADGTVEVSGDVRSSAGNATAILGTADGLAVRVNDGGFVTAQSSGSDAIRSEGANATIEVLQGGEVSISSGNSAAIDAGAMGMVTVGGTVSASSSQSQGVILGDGGMLTVTDTGIIETSSSESQAVLVGDTASTAEIQVDRGGNIDAVGAQAIVDEGMTDTTVTVDGTVFGGSSDPVIDLRAGDDTVIVNGTVRATSADPVISLGEGNDSFTDNSSTTVSGPGVLVDGGAGNDTLTLNNGSSNETSRYTGFETTTVGGNTNPNDPANGSQTTLDVNSNQSGNTINANDGGRVNVADGAAAGAVTVNVNQGGTAGVTADNAAGTGSGQGGGTINFNSGSTADVTSAGTGSTETQTFSGTNFGMGTTVSVGNSDILSGTASGNQVQLGVASGAFADAAAAQAGGSGNAGSIANALDAILIADPTALDAAIAAGDISLVTTGVQTAAQLSALSGEIAVQAGAGGFRAATLFSDVLRPGGIGGAGASGGSFASAYSGVRNAGSTNDYFADVIALDDAPLAPLASTGVWVSALGGVFDVDAGVGSPYDGHVLGVAAGVERSMSLGPLRGGTAGIAVGYTSTDVSNPFASGEVDGYHLGAYADGQFLGLQSAASVAYSYLDVEAGALSTDAHVLTSRLDAAYDLGTLFNTSVVFGPVGRLEYNYADYDRVAGFGALNQALTGGEISQFVTGIGVRLGTQIGGATARVDVMYEHAFGDTALVFGGQVAGAGFTTAAALADDDRLRVGAGLDFRASDNLEIGAQYEGTFTSDTSFHGGSIRATLRF